MNLWYIQLRQSSKYIRMVSQKSREISLNDRRRVELQHSVRRVRIMPMVHEWDVSRRAQPLNVEQAVVSQHVVPTGHYVRVRDHLRMNR